MSFTCFRQERTDCYCCGVKLVRPEWYKCRNCEQHNPQCYAEKCGKCAQHCQCEGGPMSRKTRTELVLKERGIAK
jgi:hypothetical protein